MTNLKATKKALVSSVLALVMCFTMLLGTTFAWFTDTVTSANNVIQTGTLDIGLSYKGLNETTWNDISDASEAIFDYKHWEPGYTDAKYVRISNNGTLAFKYQLNIIPDYVPAEGEFNLADVIDVYMFDTETTVDRDAIAAATPVGTLSDLMAENDGAAHGVLLPAEGKGSTNVHEDNAPVGEVVYCIVLKMREDAGNDYQGLTVGGEGFKLQLMATQYTWENDSFDHLYDEGAKLDETPKAKVEKMDENELSTIIDVTTKTVNGFSTCEDVVLNTGYVFTAPETGEEAAQNPYALWHADFVVTFNRNVTGADAVGLAGQYTYYSTDWFGAYANQEGLDALAGNDIAWMDGNEIKAGAPLRLLSDFIGVTINYEELCSNVKVFKCGAWADGDFDEPLTMTVELRLYEVGEQGDCENGGGCTHPDFECETGEYIVIGTYTYTFQ